MKEKILNLLNQINVKVETNVSGKNITSMGVGGPVDYLITVTKEEQLPEIVKILTAEKMHYIPFGSGTNIIVKDGGYRGALLRAGGELKGYSIEEKNGEIVARCWTGAPLQSLAEKLAHRGAESIESLAGIPGTVGGAIRGNSGTRKGSIGSFVKYLKVCTQEGKILELKDRDLKWDYRKISLPQKYFITFAELVFKKIEPEISVKRYKEEIEYRSNTQPLGKRTSGCIFKNPKKFKKHAGEIIEELGLKGVRVRGAQVSYVHSNFIENTGEAEARDVISLVGMIYEMVKEKAGVTLEKEIIIMGED